MKADQDRADFSGRGSTTLASIGIQTGEKDMTTWISARRVGACLIGALLTCAGAGTAGAAGLQAGEYMCVGSGGKILIGLGFKLQGDGAYTDLDGTTSGHVSYNGSNVSFVGGHLAGQVGNNVRGGTNFEIHSISCSRFR